MERSFFLKGIAALTAAGIYRPGLSIGFSQDKDITDWSQLRSQFSLPDGYHYFNTAGVGAMPVGVREDVFNFWNETEIRPKPGHSLDDWSSIKSAASRVLGVVDKAPYIGLTNSTTEGINIILNGIGWESGDEIITSTHEHPALHAPLINISKRFGVHVRTFIPDQESGMANVSKITDLCTTKTRLIFISMVTCTTGQILPIAEITKEAHKRNIMVAVDGAQVTGSMPLSLGEWDVDFYVTGGQKWLLGPKRTGLFYIKPENLDKIHPTTVGAYSENGYNIEDCHVDWAEGATRYEYATQNESLFIGLRSAVEFLEGLGLSEIQEHNRSLSENFYEQVRELKNYETFSPKEKAWRSSIISFGHNKIDYHTLAGKLMSAGFRVREVTEGGVKAVRVSFHLYNYAKEVSELVEELKVIDSKS